MAGRAKTRLIPLLGPSGAAELQQALIADTTAKASRLRQRVAKWLFVAGGKLTGLRARAGWRVSAQHGRDLGERLERAFVRLLLSHSRVVVIGTDSPLLTPRLLQMALSELRSCDAVLGPCPDGGFYLVGLARRARGLFKGARLGTRHAFRDVQKAILARGFSCAILPEIPDIDRPRDLKEFQREVEKEPSLRMFAPALWNFLGAQASRLHAGVPS